MMLSAKVISKTWKNLSNYFQEALVGDDPELSDNIEKLAKIMIEWDWLKDRNYAVSDLTNFLQILDSDGHGNQVKFLLDNLDQKKDGLLISLQLYENYQNNPQKVIFEKLMYPKTV